jgi:hypothetical protein
MSSKLSDYISQSCGECDVLPDLLFVKVVGGFQIDLSQIQLKIKDDESRVVSSIAAKNPKLKIDHKDHYSMLRKILPREQEFTEEDFEVKIILSHIICAYEVFVLLIKYLNFYWTDLSSMKKIRNLTT